MNNLGHYSEEEKLLYDKMSAEVHEHKIIDNPFDLMFYNSIELVREVLFSVRRLRNPEAPKQVRMTSDANLSKRMDNIKNEFEKLMSVSDETLQLCRDTSIFHKDKVFQFMNKNLLKLEELPKTTWTRWYPNRDLRFEAVRLGIDSKEYKRICYLNDLISTGEFSTVEKSYLYNILDVIRDDDWLVRCGRMSKKRYKGIINLIKKYDFDQYDVMYMLSCKFNV